VAVVGPLADNPSDQLGPDQPIGYDITQGKLVSVLDRIKAAVPHATVTYAQGCDTSCTSTGGFGAAVAVRQLSGSARSSSLAGLLKPAHVLKRRAK
jgi:hypothetical protein